MASTHIRVSKEFFKEIKNNRKRGESFERTILNSNMNKLDKKLNKIFDDQDQRRKIKFKQLSKRK